MNKSAREMFEGLDFILVNEQPITYIRDDGGYITKYLFNDVMKRLEIREWEEYNDKKPQGVTILYKEHIEAINKQIEELGWLDE